jgi:PadR family transcriptional regulator PadR
MIDWMSSCPPCRPCGGRPASLFSLRNRDKEGQPFVSRDGVGDLELRVLLVIHHLRGQGYAVSIADEIQQRSGKSVSLGAIYGTVDRLEKKGLVSSELGAPTPERGGKPKRFYKVSAPGLLALSKAREVDARMWADAPPLGAPA